MKSIVDTLLEAAFGIVKHYQEESVALAKIEVAALYLKSLKIVRRQFLALSCLLFCMVVLAAALVAIPVALLFYAPWDFSVKAWALGGLAILYIGIPSILLVRFFSEEKWMEMSKSNEFMKEAVKSN